VGVSLLALPRLVLLAGAICLAVRARLLPGGLLLLLRRLGRIGWFGAVERPAATRGEARGQAPSEPVRAFGFGRAPEAVPQPAT